MNRRMTGGLDAPSRQAGSTLIEIVIVLAIIAILATLAAPLWSHGTSLVAKSHKPKIDIGERTTVAVLAFQKPRWSYTSSPVQGGTVTLKFSNGITIVPGSSTEGTATTNHQGAALFTVQGDVAGKYTGKASFKVGSDSWGDVSEVKIEVTATEFTHSYEGSSLDWEDD
jgi:prepilin-type N-terminal cleavage/methylation domain-containing protein